jgi:glycosyltransferase involved in cell wall biosynthesis
VAVRLLLVLPVPARGGAEGYALTIGRAARRRGWIVEALVPRGPGTATLCDDLEAAGIRHSDLSPVDRLSRDDPEPSALTKLRSAGGFARAARRFEPDVVHITLPWPTFGYPFLVTSALMSLPAVVTFQLVPDQGVFIRRRRRLVYKWALNRGQRWIAVSDHGRRLVSALYRVDPAEIRVIHNGAPTANRAPANLEREAVRASVRAELGIPATAPLLLALGRLHPQKGYADLACAAAGISAERPDIRVVIAGEGPERAHLEELIQALGAANVVRLLGHRTDADRLMDAADLFVFPSHFEGTPFAVLEAMSHRLPVITAAFGGAREIVEDGRTGIVVPVARPNAFRIAVLDALADPERLQRLAEAGHDRVRAFSEAAMIDATLRELERVRTS